MAEQKVSEPTGVGGLVPPRAETNPPAKGLRPFRKATILKYISGATDTLASLTAAAQPLGNRVLEGTGFLRYVDLVVQATTSGNAANVAFKADAPWNAIQSLRFQATGTDIINLSGHQLYLANLYGGFGVWPPQTSTDTNIYQAVTGSGSTGGSFRFRVRVPLSINDRSLIGLLGNQAQSTKYEMPIVIAPSSDIYSTAPTTAPSVSVTRLQGIATVPAPVDAYGQPQEQVPGHYGILHTLFAVQSEALATSGAARVNHYLRGIGNILRYTIIVFRDSTGARTDAMLPTNITFFIGSDPIFTETAAQRRAIMLDQFGFDAPAGVLVYTWDDDFLPRAGFGLGDDFLDTTGIANAQFMFDYPTFSNSPGTVVFIHDQLVVPSGLDYSAYM